MNLRFDHLISRLAFASVILLAACDVDYDLGARDREPRVVVIALLTPQEDFVVKLHWSTTYSGDKMKFRPVENADIRLFENGAEAFECAASPDGETKTSFRAAAGRDYRLEIDVAGYGKLTASTTIPEPPTARLDATKEKGHYRHFELSTLDAPAEAKSIWIKGTETVDRGEYWENFPEGRYQVSDISEYYTTSPFVDQINGVNDTYHAEDKGSTVDFEEFLRIPYENREAVLPLRFSVWGSSDGMTKYSHSFRIITASDAYDRYMKSRYKQEQNSGWNGEGNPFIEQITVYSNIENGLGIFAGYNYHKTPEL